MDLLLIDDEGRFSSAEAAPPLQLRPSVEGDIRHPPMCEQGSAFVAAGEAALRVNLCPTHICERALSALMYWLADQRIERVVLAVLDRAWLHEVVPTRHLAQRRILDLVSLARCNREGRFLTRPADVASLEPGHPMRALIAECGARFNRHRVADILRNGLKNRFTTVRVDPGSGELVVVDMGDGYGSYSQRQRRSIIGARIEDQPDYDYGRWIANGYRELIARGSPTLEDVDALVAWPQRDPVRHRYRRLVIPAARGGEAWLLSASLEEPDLDLRGGLPSGA